MRANVSTQHTVGDERIRYPSYKCFDEFIDIDRLKALDDYIMQGIKRHLATKADLKFYTGPFRLNESAPDRPGSRMIYLSQSGMPDSYFDLDKPDLWRPSPATAEFPLLMDFIATLPFESTGRMLIMYDDVYRPVPAHRDHTDKDICHEFIWFRTNLKKPFYLLNPQTNQKQYVESYSAWFDTVNQFHGSDPCDGISFSIRVDGVFTEQFRRQIPSLKANRSATPALWASLSKPNKPVSSAKRGIRIVTGSVQETLSQQKESNLLIQ